MSLKLFIMVIIMFTWLPIAGAETDSQNIIKPELVEKIELLVSEGNIPSLQVAVVHEDKMVWSHSFGENTSTEHVYMNASVQKVFDATAILQLYEKEIIDIDADINSYLPFEVRHPDFPDLPITIRMILGHRSGLESFWWQFSWDTECLFYPEFRQNCNPAILEMSLGEYLAESLAPDGSNYNPSAWKAKPGDEYHYSISTFPLLRYVIEQVTGQTYPDYMKENIFSPLEMNNSGFTFAEFEEHHAVPHTRIDKQNITLPQWNGNGYMMRTTAEDMGKFMIAHMNNGRYRNFQLLQSSTIELMRNKTTERRSPSNLNSNLYDADHGLGIYHYFNGWLGYGGSTVGYQTYWRFNTNSKSGYIITINVNGILKGGKNHESVNNSFIPIKELLEEELGPKSNFVFYMVSVFCIIAFAAGLIIYVFKRSVKPKIVNRH